jgi:4,4'-diaponeurosporenoate glycosyltransferase
MMAAVVVAVSACGLCAGFLLFRKDRRAASIKPSDDLLDTTVIIPARNEARNLVPLLESLQRSSARPAAILVVDDDSEDDTADVARAAGAAVLTSAEKPADWKGKPWACWQGAQHAATPLLLFVDADTRFTPGGLQRMRGLFGPAHQPKALSILPWHRTIKAYEELSVFFNLLVATGAGGFSGLDREHGLFGQSMLIQRDVYFRAGGHAAVRQHVLENFHFAVQVRNTGGTVETALGRGVLEMRMFPDGLPSLRASWIKGFANGAGATQRATMLLSILWLTGAATPVAAGLLGSQPVRMASAVMYLLNGLQMFYLGRKVGAYRWYTAAGYAVPLVFYFVLFAQSALRARTKQEVLWKGRPV